MPEEKKTPLFRKKSEEYIDSPEKLDYYLHVTTPGVWALLAAVIVLLIGALAWSIMGRLDTHVTVAVVSENGKCAAYVTENAINAVVENRKAVIDGREITLEPSSLEPIVVTDSTNVYVRLAGGLSVGDIVYEIPVSDSLEDGVYSATVTTETVSPISLLLN